MTLVLVGIAAGLLSGMLGVGGGVLFVPVLVVAAGHGHVEAEATSLLAIVPVALVGAANQRRYGNLRLRDGLLLGATAVPGAVVGVLVVNAVPERAVEVAFALLLLYVAFTMARRGLREDPGR
ncbi:TSUP family transporter [Conexibacter sp. SYSU D00693]|uniref:TSUP family transporter n=1 Tax=Conexibacter sp. SYSU D00693 TaxID=2812560 RepID=UPI001F11A617|nr:TSUP family transporter [Conexibacter sp. SYSU D00693]